MRSSRARRANAFAAPRILKAPVGNQDRKSTRLNSSHTVISYAVFCLKKKKINARLRCKETQFKDLSRVKPERVKPAANFGTPTSGPHHRACDVATCDYRLHILLLVM